MQLEWMLILSRVRLHARPGLSSLYTDPERSRGEDPGKEKKRKGKERKKERVMYEYVWALS